MDYLTRFSTGQRWQQMMQEEEEARRIEVEQRRYAESERRAGETRLPQLETRLSNSSWNPNVQHNPGRQPSSSMIAELDSAPRHDDNRMQLPPTPPESSTERDCGDARYRSQESLSHHLHAQVQEQSLRIGRLETELQSTKSETLRIRAERDRYEREHIQAIRTSNQQEARRLRQQVDQLAECLNEVKARERELEADLDAAMTEKRELRRKLQRAEDERSDLEHDLERLRATTGSGVRHGSDPDHTYDMPATEISAGGQGNEPAGQEGVQGTVGRRRASAGESRSVSISRATQKSRETWALSVPRGQRRDYGTAYLVKSVRDRISS
ncbi:MAG: hypothetical protein Q9216_001603 [Gyalolechia sp. 2 TL-2023]